MRFYIVCFVWKTPSLQTWGSLTACYEVSGLLEHIAKIPRKSTVWTSAQMAKMLYQAATTTALCYMTSGKEGKWPILSHGNIIIMNELQCIFPYLNMLNLSIWRCFKQVTEWTLAMQHVGSSGLNTPSLLRPKGTLFSKKYGVDLIRYTHGDTQTVVYSSNKLDGNNSVSTNSQLSGK